MTDATRTVVLKPGDMLFIGNVGQTSEEALDALRQGAAQLRSALGLANVTLFEQDINVAAVAPVVPAPDAVVLRVFDREAVARHREVLAAWLRSNGIDPKTVDADWLSIEQAGGRRLIRYRSFRLTQDGHKVIDPASPNSAWTVERVSPLVIDLDLSAAQTVTDGD